MLFRAKIICFILFFIIIPKSIFAVNITILNSPSTISSDPFTLTASISGALNGTNYLRIDLFKESTTDYFGETFNGTSWYNGSSYDQYFPVTIISGTPWSGDIQGKIGSLPANGLYKLKLRRYTASGSQSSSDPVDVSINIPTPILTPTSDLTPTPTPEITPSPTLTPTLIPTSTIIPTQLPVSYNNIYLSEVMVYPETNDNEWIEIYNNNDFMVYLHDWYIDDIENGGASAKNFSLDINPRSYAALNLTSSMFNNSGDSVRLLDFDKNLKDSFEYTSSAKGKSLGRIFFDSDDFCLQEPSKGSSNKDCSISPSPTQSPTSTPEKSPTPTKIPVLKKETKSDQSPKVNTVSVNENETTVLFGSSESDKNEFQQDIPIQNDEEVLGISTKNKSYIPVSRSFTFASFSFSVLTISSILVKIIKGLSSP